MDTGYSIDGGLIYGPDGYSGYGINNKNHIVGPRGDTRHWIYGSHIYSAKEGNTGFWLDENRIHGPVAKPPWEPKRGPRNSATPTFHVPRTPQQIRRQPRFP